jgi:aspartokinase-like uncharacterized kinase
MQRRTAHEIEGGWVYAMVSRRGGGPLGYCRDHESTPHATEVEARECYARYLRDKLRGGGTSSWTDCAAQSCPNPANHVWDVVGEWWRSAVLCDEHNDRDTAIATLRLNQAAGDSYGSG